MKCIIQFSLIHTFVSLNNNFLQNASHFVLLEIGIARVGLHIGHFAFKRAGERDHNGSVVVGINPFFQFRQPGLR